MIWFSFAHSFESNSTIDAALRCHAKNFLHWALSPIQKIFRSRLAQHLILKSPTTKKDPQGSFLFALSFFFVYTEKSKKYVHQRITGVDRHGKRASISNGK